jgi:hypothetical protein
MVGLEVNTENTKYMIMSRYQNAEQNYNFLIAAKYFKDLANLKYLGTTKRMKITFTKKLRAYSFRRTLADFFLTLSL